MIEILEHLQQYVPGARSSAELEQIQERFLCSCEFWQKIKVHKKCEYFTNDYYFREDRNPKMRAIPVGGDQLTCERRRSAHMACLDGDSQEERLEGLITMVEDFHEKMNFLQVMYSNLNN